MPNVDTIIEIQKAAIEAEINLFNEKLTSIN